MQIGKAQVQDVGGHAAEDPKEIQTSSWWISNHPGSDRISPHEVLQSWLINTVYHLLVNINKGEGRRSLLIFFPWKDWKGRGWAY